MGNWTQNLFSIRNRLLLLVLCAVLPGILAHYDHAGISRERMLAGERANLEGLARLAAFELERTIRSTRQQGWALAEIQAVRDLQVEECSRILARAVRDFGFSTNVVIGKDRFGVCSGVAREVSRTSYADRHYLAPVFASGETAVGLPVIGHLVKKAGLPVAVPVRSASGEVHAALSSLVDLESFSQQFLQAQARRSLVFSLWGEDGRIFYRYPDPEKWVGRQMGDAPLLTHALSVKDLSGARDVEGLDGVLRVYGFAALDEFRATGLHISLGVDKAELEAEADVLFRHARQWILLTLGLALLAAWFLGYRQIWLPVRALKGIAARLARGDYAARIGEPYRTDELGALAQTFDRMAVAAQQRVEDLRIANNALEIRVAERTAELEASRNEVLRQNEALEAASQMKSEFLANMSHELRTPLNAIIGFSEVLKDGLAGTLTGNQGRYVENIFSSGEHLLALINDILDLSKVEAGMMTLDVEAIDVARILGDSLSIIKEKALAHRIALRLELPTGDETLPADFLADPRRLKQMLYNLLSNAVKFGGDGGEVVLRARRVPRADAGRLPGILPGRVFPLPPGGATHYLEIAVCDRGIGIDAAALGFLFQPFRQIDSSLAREFEGTGLGLVMIRKLAELHGGCVGVETAPGQGACFLAWLPWGTASEAAAPGGAPQGAVPAAAAALADVPAAGDAHRPWALVVEDDAAAADLIALHLRAEGFAVQCAHSAEEALQVAATLPLSLLTLDILLPGMDGWDLLARLRAMPGFARLPVVIISIVADPQRGLALGASAVLQKPVSREVLTEVLAGLALVPPRHEPPLRVLVVDDDPLAVELLASCLAGDEYAVLRAFNGQQALTLARQSLPDIILLDLFMPEMSGFDVVRAMRADAALSEIPVIVLTARTLGADERAQLNGEVLRVVDKSAFSREAFLREVRQAMQSRAEKKGAENGGA